MVGPSHCLLVSLIIKNRKIRVIVGHRLADIGVLAEVETAQAVTDHPTDQKMIDIEKMIDTLRISIEMFRMTTEMQFLTKKVLTSDYLIFLQ